MSVLTLDILQRAVPNNLKKNIDQSLVDTLNSLQLDPLIADEVRSNIVSFTSVLRDSLYNIKDYVSAVTYVSFKLRGDSNIQAYVKTFPNRYARLVSIGTSEKDIACYVRAYNKNKLVNQVLEQSMVPTWVLNQDLYQKALNVQADLMMNANSEKVRTDAANSILVHLAKPKESGPLINIDMREDTGIKDLKQAMVDLAIQQRTSISEGMSPASLAEMKIVSPEVIDNV